MRLLAIGQTVLVRFGPADFQMFYSNAAKWNGHIMFVSRVVKCERGESYQIEDAEGVTAAGPTGIPYLFLEGWLVPQGER